MENLIRTARPLTWRPEQRCERCSLPFTSKSDGLVDRQPFLLSCRHLLCGQCVRECTVPGVISCQRCKQETPLSSAKFQDVTDELDPSYYMLGVLERMEKENDNISLYWEKESQKEHKTVHHDPASFEVPAQAFTLHEDLSTPANARIVLEKAYHLYEKSKFVLDKRAKTDSECVLAVLRKVNGHFLSLHNALQMEENRVLQKIRKAFLQEHQQNKRNQERLQTTKKRLKQMHGQIKLFPANPEPNDLAWKTFTAEAKAFFETEPLKMLYTAGAKRHKTINYEECDRFSRNISSCYKLTLRERDKDMQLVPYAVEVKLEPVASLLSEKNKGKSAPIARKTIPDERPTCSERGRDRTISSTNERQSKSGQLRPLPREKKDGHLNDFDRMFSSVTVTWIVSPHEFYIKDSLFDEQKGNILSELCQVEAEAYELELTPGKAPLVVQTGSLYLVRQKLSSTWYRAEVLRELGAAPEECGPYVVQYIDFGRTETVEHNQIRPLSVELEGIVRGVTKCKLFGIVPSQRDCSPDPSDDCWAPECVQVMNDFIRNEKVLLYQVSKTPDYIVVDLFLTPVPHQSHQKPDVTGWEGYYAPQSLRDTLLYLQLCKPKKRGLRCKTSHKIEELNQWVKRATRKSLQWQNLPVAPELQEYEFINVRVTHAGSPAHFFITPEEWKRQEFDSLQRELDVLCRTPATLLPYEGLVCGFSVAEGVWQRGRVESVLPRGCEVVALDTGERLFVGSQAIRLLPPGSVPMLKHPFAVPCRLEHLRPRQSASTYGGSFDGVSWSQEAITEFAQITRTSTMQLIARIGRMDGTNGVYDVLLYLRNRSDRDTCVNRLLVAQGHAECAGSEDEIKDRMRQPEESDPAETKAEPEDNVVDPRTLVRVLKIISPSEFYVALESRAAALAQLHRSVQEYMDDAVDNDGDGSDPVAIGWSVGDLCVVFASAKESGPSEWFRARIVSVLEGGVQYEAFLIDRAVMVRVHRSNVDRLTASIGQVQPGAIRCQLACVEPLDGRTDWHQSSVDAFSGAIHRFPKHAISLDVQGAGTGPSQPEALVVVLWGIRESVQHALAPVRMEFRNINQQLQSCGMVRKTGRFRTFATRGSAAIDELHSLESAIDALTQVQYEKLQQFFLTVADVTETAPGGEGATQRDGSKTAETVLTANWHQDADCAAMLELVDETARRISEWPAAFPTVKTVFVGIPTSIGSDGTVFLYDICQEPVLNRMRTVINEYVERHPRTSPVFKKFRPGEPCLARFQLDGLYYRGLVLQDKGHDRYSVLFVDYGNEELCSGTDLRREVVCASVPVQTNRFKLAGVVPKKLSTKSSAWPEEAIEVCHGLVVQKRVSVSAEWPDSPSGAIPCKMRLVSQSIDVDAALLKLGLFRRVVNSPAKPPVSAQPLTKAVSHKRPDQSSVSTPEQRDLLRFMEAIQNEYQPERTSGTDGIEDPNEFVEGEDISNWLNRAQFIHFDPLGANECPEDDDDEGPSDGPNRRFVVDSPLRSPMSFNSSEFETSSRLSDGEGLPEPKPGRDSLFGCYAQLPLTDRPTTGFFAEFTSFDVDLTLHVYPHMDGHTQRMARMSQLVQQVARSENFLYLWQARLLEPGDPCLAPYSVDGLYYRAMVEAVFEERDEMRVLYVDYLNRETLPMGDIRKCPVSLQRVPLRNIRVRLTRVYPNPRMRLDDVARRLVELLQRPFFVKIVGLSASNDSPPVQEVELYEDFECRRLVYQKMIEEKYFLVGAGPKSGQSH